MNQSMSKAAIIIPARWASTRMPGKPLHLLAGKPLVRHVWERCSKVPDVDRIIIATDDMRIAEAAFEFGAEVTLTSDKHPCGTDRIAEVAKKLSGFGIIVNVQGDEPFIDPKLPQKLIQVLREDKALAMSTAACPMEPTELGNPNCVKVVTDIAGNALYFSRAPIPCDRDGDANPSRLRHLGIYGYRRKFLLEFVKWKQTPLEKSEKLEQLRALEHGAHARFIGEQFTSEFIRIATGRMRDFIEHALAEKTVLRRANRAPETDRDGQLRIHAFEQAQRHAILIKQQTRSRADVGQSHVFAQAFVREQRLTGSTPVQGEQAALAIDRGAITRHVRRPIEVVAHVLLATPDEIDRAPRQLARNQNGLPQCIGPTVHR